MKTPLTLFIGAILVVGCSSWAPDKSVTLHDIDPDLAATEGADLRYQLADPVECSGMECRNLTTSSHEFATYHWRAVCDGQFCDAAQLEYVAVVREAAEIAFTADQIVAARGILTTRTGTLAERAQLDAFIADREQPARDRIHELEDALTRMSEDDALAEMMRRQEATSDLLLAWAHLQRGRELLGMPQRVAGAPSFQMGATP